MTRTDNHVSLLPGIVYLLTPICLVWAKPRIVMYPPGGSSVADGVKVMRVAQKEAKGFIKEEDWEAAKPTKMRENGRYDAIVEKHRPGWISWDDQFVDELKTTLKAMQVFCLLPVWYMADSGTNTILTNMAGSLTTDSLPNDLMQVRYFSFPSSPLPFHSMLYKP